jgi:hypothetical protein
MMDSFSTLLALHVMPVQQTARPVPTVVEALSVTHVMQNMPRGVMMVPAKVAHPTASSANGVAH